VIVQEHTVEDPQTGHTTPNRYVPNKLVCRSSGGEEASITALIKTQGSDTKLVAQMQPLYEAKGMDRVQLAGKSVPSLVTQIADGENGGVMMNEFPEKYKQGIREASDSESPCVNGTEFLEWLESQGITEDDFPVVQPIWQKMIWENMKPGDGPKKLEEVIKKCKEKEGRFNVEGGSWTNDRSWVQGYEDVIGPMEKASSMFSEKALKDGVSTDDHRFRNALYHLLISQTSCYRYWGEGEWTEYGKELCRRTMDILQHDF
jgi:hypothetical protein